MHDRRAFLAAGLTLAGAARSAARVIGANDRINVGMIGVGGMGFAHLRDFVRQSDTDRDIQVVAVCDVYTKRKERARAAAKLQEKDAHHDYRDLLARSDIDAVLIATPDHWHARQAVDAIAAGKDVYVQKPMTYTIAEARAVADAARKHGRIVQVGSQGLSSPGTQKARELIAEGRIGEVLWAQATSSRNSSLGEWNWRVEPEGTAETIDWPRWLGPAPKRPFSPERYFRWRKYWDYSGGIATDLFYHSIGPLIYATDAGLPVSVSATGGIYVQKDREVPDTYATTVEYPNFYMTLSGSMANAAGNRHHGTAIYGHKGTITFERGAVVLTPEIITPSAFDKRPDPVPERFALPPREGDGHRLHTDNFFSCMRTRKKPNLDAELGYAIMVAIRLGVDAYRARQTKYFGRAPKRPEWEGDGRNHSPAS
jgi:predicted dehydrogenase